MLKGYLEAKKGTFKEVDAALCVLCLWAASEKRVAIRPLTMQDMADAYPSVFIEASRCFCGW